MATVTALLFFSFVSMTLPIFNGYGFALFLLMWLLWAGNWRLGMLNARAQKLSEGENAEFTARLRSIVKPLHLGVAAMLLASLLSVILSTWLSPYAPPLGKALSKWSHLMVKHGLLWYVLTTAVIAAVRRGFRPRVLLVPIFIWLLVLAVYVTAQRLTGIDWVHGFDTVLPPNRFAYSVYRVSGFMGHPLTFAYNLMLIILFAGAFAIRAKQSSQLGRDTSAFDGSAKWWFGIAAISLYMLAISGSRFPLLILMILLAWVMGRQLWRYKHWVLVFGLVALTGLWLEGSILGRFSELFDQSVPLMQRFQRLVFWQAHLNMFLDHPLAGVGIAGYDKARLAYYTAIGVHDTMYTAHNIYLQVLADSGVCGFLGMLLLGVSVFIAARRAAQYGGGKAVILMLGGTLISGLMHNNLRDSEYLYALWLLLAWGAVCAARPIDNLTLERDERE